MRSNHTKARRHKELQKRYKIQDTRENGKLSVITINLCAFVPLCEFVFSQIAFFYFIGLFLVVAGVVKVGQISPLTLEKIALLTVYIWLKLTKLQRIYGIDNPQSV